MGIAVIEDDVDIGSNSTICRATAGETRIGRGTILDCHVHIAHNCVVGENGAFACGVAIAGSTKIGKDVTLAGQVGIAGHAKIADGVTILAQSGIAGSHSKPGEVFFGSPATERKDALRRWAAVGRLPKLLEDFRKLRDEIQRIQERLGEGGNGPPE